jgi:hypothetical protein
MIDNPQIVTLGRRPARLAPPFRPGDRVIYQPRPDGLEEVVDVLPCWESGRHRMLTKRSIGELVQATRCARTCDFKYARIAAGKKLRGWRRRTGKTKALVDPARGRRSRRLCGVSMMARLTRIPRGSPLRAPGATSWDWQRAGVLPIAAGGLSAALWALLTTAFAVAAWVLP